jgi:hypothetical protein
MGAFRLAIAVAALGYIVYAYHHVMAQVTDPATASLPQQTSSLDIHPTSFSGCAVTLNSAPGQGCPAQQGQGVIPGNE